jgi:hypothetical protein
MGASRAQEASPWPESLHSVLRYKRLQKGRFRPSFSTDGHLASSAIEAAELALVVEGIDLAGARRRPRWQPAATRRSKVLTAGN